MVITSRFLPDGSSVALNVVEILSLLPSQEDLGRHAKQQCQTQHGASLGLSTRLRQLFLIRLRSRERQGSPRPTTVSHAAAIAAVILRVTKKSQKIFSMALHGSVFFDKRLWQALGAGKSHPLAPVDVMAIQPRVRFGTGKQLQRQRHGQIAKPPADRAGGFRVVDPGGVPHDALDSRPSNLLVRLERLPQRARVPEALRQHHGILDRHRCALSGAW